MHTNTLIYFVENISENLLQRFPHFFSTKIKIKSVFDNLVDICLTSRHRNDAVRLTSFEQQAPDNY